MNQLDLFELYESEVQMERQEKAEPVNFQIGETVKVKTIKNGFIRDIEDYYYIKQFENKKGVIIDKTLNKKTFIVIKLILAKRNPVTSMRRVSF